MLISTIHLLLFAGMKGPQMKQSFHGGTSEDVFLTKEVGVASVALCPCGASAIFHINTTLSTRKDEKDDDDVHMGVDSVNVNVDWAFHYYFFIQEC